MLSTLLDTALALALVPSRVLGLFSLALALVLSQAQDRAEDFTERVKCEADEFTNVLASSLSAKTARILHMVIRPCAPMEAWDANRHLHERTVPQGAEGRGPVARSVTGSRFRPFARRPFASLRISSMLLSPDP